MQALTNLPSLTDALLVLTLVFLTVHLMIDIINAVKASGHKHRLWSGFSLAVFVGHIITAHLEV